MLPLKTISSVNSRYRPDIDGLRAIAVLSVVGFHAFPNQIKGGFIGVDVFFVISGYLISTILFEKFDNNSFTFFEFYSRRIRRIFPALTLVLIACYIFGWFALLSEEYRQLGKHIASGAGFISNIVFWLESGYFDNAANTKPLLHLWSLGIEEQFYILWPVFLWVAWKQKFNFLFVVVLAMLTSFFLNVKSVNQDVVATFYSPQTRFWELLSGSLLAWATLYKSDSFARIAKKLEQRAPLIFSHKNRIKEKLPSLVNILSFIGLLFLFFGIWRINRDTVFPGNWALIPVLGALLLITSGPRAWLNRKILSNKFLVFIGLISFPLYLWHWPLISFAHIIEGDLLSINFRIAILASSFFLAWATYRLIERPMRFGCCGKLKTLALILLLLAVGCVGYKTHELDGLSFRPHASIKGFKGDIGHLEYHKYIAENYYICTPKSIADNALKWETYVRCMQSKGTFRIDIALVGDSHAEHLFLGMAEALPSKNVVYYNLNSTPVISNPQFKSIFSFVLENKDIHEVVLTMYWYQRYKSIPLGSNLEQELLKTIDALLKSGKKVLLVDDVPSFPFPPEKCQGQRWLSRKNPSCEMSADEVRKQSETYIETLNIITKKRPNVLILNIGKYLCDNKVCSMTMGDKILYRDPNHLNLEGSRLIGRRLVENNRNIFY